MNTERDQREALPQSRGGTEVIAEKNEEDSNAEVTETLVLEAFVIGAASTQHSFKDGRQCLCYLCVRFSLFKLCAYLRASGPPR
jgi:hypothetical protein